MKSSASSEEYKFHQVSNFEEELFTAFIEFIGTEHKLQVVKDLDHV